MIVNMLCDDQLLTYRDCCLQAVDYLYLLMKFGKDKYLFGRCELLQTSENTFFLSDVFTNHIGFKNYIVKILHNGISTIDLQINIATIIANTLNNLFSRFLSKQFYDKKQSKYFQLYTTTHDPVFVWVSYNGEIVYRIMKDMSYISNKHIETSTIYSYILINNAKKYIMIYSDYDYGYVIKLMCSKKYTFKADCNDELSHVVFKMTQKMIVYKICL